MGNLKGIQQMNSTSEGWQIFSSEILLRIHRGENPTGSILEFLGFSLINFLVRPKTTVSRIALDVTTFKQTYESRLEQIYEVFENHSPQWLQRYGVLTTRPSIIGKGA